LDATDPGSAPADIETVKVLLDHRADASAASANGSTALHSALRRGHHGVIDLVLSSNANVNAVDVGHNSLLLFSFSFFLFPLFCTISRDAEL
jgi:ankyrin repeat protein